MEMASFEEAENKVKIMSIKSTKLVQCNRIDDAYETLVSVLNYIISAEGSVLLANNDFKDGLVGAIISNKNIMHNYIRLVNEPTREFICRELRNKHLNW